MKSKQLVVTLIVLLAFSLTVTAQDNHYSSDKDEILKLKTFMNSFLTRRSNTAALTGSSIIMDDNRLSTDFYYQDSIRFNKSASRQDTYVILDNNWSIDSNLDDIPQLTISRPPNDVDNMNEEFPLVIRFTALSVLSSDSLSPFEHHETYTVRYKVIKYNGKYQIYDDGYIPGFQYIFESDLETLLERRRATLALDKPIPPAPQEFKGTKGIVTGKNVAVRNVPGVQGTVVDSVIQKQLVDIQEYAGSGNMMDGIWDYWARIGENRWVNASYVFETPFYFRKPNDVSSIFYEVSTIKDDNVNASSRAIDCVGYSTVSKEDMTLRSVNLDENNLYRGLYLISHIWKLQMKDSQLADAIAAVIDDKYYKGPDPSIPLRGVRYENGGISVDVLPYMENEIEGFTITTPEVFLFFGVRVGMTWDEVCSILGKPLANIIDIVDYQYDKERRLRLQFTDGILTSITYNHYL